MRELARLVELLDDIPSIVVYEAAGDGVLHERQRATGNERLVVDHPFAVQLNPAALVRTPITPE